VADLEPSAENIVGSGYYWQCQLSYSYLQLAKWPDTASVEGFELLAWMSTIADFGGLDLRAKSQSLALSMLPRSESPLCSA
jgi:hypothetical protein